MDSGTGFGTGALYLLAIELANRGFEAKPARGSANVLRVTPPEGEPGLVAQQAGKFWWEKSQEPIGPSCDIRVAADEIARVLGAEAQ